MDWTDWFSDDSEKRKRDSRTDSRQSTNNNNSTSEPGPHKHPHDAVLFGVGLELAPGQLIVDGLTPGCSAEKSGSVIPGDELIAVDGAEDLTVSHAKQLMMGRQGSYATVTFRRMEGANLRSFKVQLMRGAADYIFLVEALRSLETQNGRLTKENERLRANQGDPEATKADQERIRELLESNEELYGQVKTYKGKLNTAEDEILRLRYQQDELNAQSKKVAELLRRVNEAEGENDGLRKGMKEIDQERYEEKQYYRLLQEKLKKTEEEVERLRRELEKEPTIPDTSDKDEEIERLAAKVAELEKIAGEVRNLKGMVLNRNNKIAMLEEELEDAKNAPPQVLEVPAPQHSFVEMPMASALPIQTLSLSPASPPSRLYVAGGAPLSTYSPY
uniref:PDZ domain-containing protein n=1 Tax=Hemiselmis tepida TaxID=464990 RepID=A0A7S0YLJ3_9CRYP|mmetsp:Transcript_14229/g.36346  ORF Transcript_14229/g.36346 Transcript_14229/m.36346 type:complete len:389 (+) Transcript_14229:30-1196(+)